jgi:hypothetical protein
MRHRHFRFSSKLPSTLASIDAKEAMKFSPVCLRKSPGRAPLSCLPRARKSSSSTHPGSEKRWDVIDFRRNPLQRRSAFHPGTGPHRHSVAGGAVESGAADRAIWSPPAENKVPFALFGLLEYRERRVPSHLAGESLHGVQHRLRSLFPCLQACQPYEPVAVFDFSCGGGFSTFQGGN